MALTHPWLPSFPTRNTGRGSSPQQLHTSSGEGRCQQPAWPPQTVQTPLVAASYCPFFNGAILAAWVPELPIRTVIPLWQAPPPGAAATKYSDEWWAHSSSNCLTRPLRLERSNLASSTQCWHSNRCMKRQGNKMHFSAPWGMSPTSRP